jgi:hypothetical protein
MTDNDPHLTSGLLPGVLTGLGAMIVGAAAYGALIGFSGYEIGYAAVGVGILVGLAMMMVKQPTSLMLPPLAAFFSLAGAVLGQLAGETLRWAQTSGLDYGTAAGETLQTFPEQLQAQPVSILFWVISYAGFGFVNKLVKSARAALATPSLPQRDEAEYVDNFTPKKQS